MHRLPHVICILHPWRLLGSDSRRWIRRPTTSEHCQYQDGSDSFFKNYFSINAATNQVLIGPGTANWHSFVQSNLIKRMVRSCVVVYLSTMSWLSRESYSCTKFTFAIPKFIDAGHKMFETGRQAHTHPDEDVTNFRSSSTKKHIVIQFPAQFSLRNF